MPESNSGSLTPESGSYITITVPPLKCKLKYSLAAERNGPWVLLPQPPIETWSERSYRSSSSLALNHNREKVLLSIDEISKDLKLKKKILTQVYLTSKQWLNHQANWMCVFSLVGVCWAISQNMPRWLCGASSLSSVCPTPGWSHGSLRAWLCHAELPGPGMLLVLTWWHSPGGSWEASFYIHPAPAHGSRQLDTRWLATAHWTTHHQIEDFYGNGSYGHGWIMETPALRGQVRNEPKG